MVMKSLGMDDEFAHGEDVAIVHEALGPDHGAFWQQGDEFRQPLLPVFGLGFAHARFEDVDDALLTLHVPQSALYQLPVRQA